MSIVVARVLEAEPVAGKEKLKRLVLDVGGGQSIQVVTNAPNAEAGKRVVVAQVGAEVGNVVVRKATVGGVASEGMLLDPTMLGWSGGGAGVAALVPASYAPGDAPPSARPRLDERAAGADGGSAPGPAAGREVEPLFARKPSKEEKKAAAAARKAERGARKAGADCGVGDGGSGGEDEAE